MRSMASQVDNFGHQHPLVVLNEEASNESEAAAADQWYCSRCGEAIMISSPAYRCSKKECRFYVHKQCAEAPSQMNHPFHPDHPLSLLPNPPQHYTRCICTFCGEEGTKFVYHCSCNIDLHIKCALFTCHKNFRDELQLVACKVEAASNHSSTTSGNNTITSTSSNAVAAAKCYVCWEPLLDVDGYVAAADCGFKLHKKCAELPLEINYPGHRNHPLILQFNAQTFSSCIIGHDSAKILGFCYRCRHPPCNYVIHIPCLSPPSVIEDKKAHPHPFTLLLRTFPFTCDACGTGPSTEGKGFPFPYMCSTCNLIVHKECISLPRIIQHSWHEHPIFHTYSFPRHESKTWECVLCLDEVKTEHGSYNCSHCNFILHVKCVIKYPASYSIIDQHQLENKYDHNLGDPGQLNSFTVVERNDVGEASKINHFTHQHDLLLVANIAADIIPYCDGCTLLISDSVYYWCSQCNFFLHKICAEFPKKKHEWAHECRLHRILISDCIFKCDICWYVCNGFAYKCDECRSSWCLRCIVPYTLKCQGHEHPLSFHWDHKGVCNACGGELYGAYHCKRCNFALHYKCLLLPPKAPHKCDEHLLKLTYHEDNSYPQSHVCDICEKDRNPSHWFYRCATCDNSAHRECVLGRYPFMKTGKVYKEGDQYHPHPLTFVKRAYDYPECFKCGEPCQDLAVECAGESRCGYIVHWDCIAPPRLMEPGPSGES